MEKGGCFFPAVGFAFGDLDRSVSDKVNCPISINYVTDLEKITAADGVQECGAA